MTAYIDASVVLRIALGDPRPLVEWSAIQIAVASSLARVECLRTIDRLRLRHALPDEVVAERRAAVERLLSGAHGVAIDDVVLQRAALPLPTSLGTLDTIHLATAMLWRESSGTDIVMATHDEALARAARACGLRAVGA